MKMARLSMVLVATGLLVGSQTARADGGWSLAKLNPFAKSDKSANSSRNSNSPSVLQEIGNDTKKVVGATTDLVTLKWLAPKPAPPKKTYWSHFSHTKQPEKKSFLSSLFGPKDPPQPKTLREWMGQKRPEP